MPTVNATQRAALAAIVAENERDPVSLGRAIAICAEHGINESDARTLLREAVKTPRRAPKPYAVACAWIAANDNPGEQTDNPESVQGYVTVALVADLYGRTQDEVARDVVRARHA